MPQELRILLLEDHAPDAELMMRELRREAIPFTAKRVWTEAAFIEELRLHTPDLILADYSLPAYDGLTALGVATKEYPEIPFIIVSGSLGEETAIDALQHGARDYILKQRLARLGPAVRRALRETELAAERKHVDEQLHQLLYAIEQSPISIIITDTDGVIEYVNAKFTELTGYSREEAIGQNPRMLKSGKAAPEFYDTLWRTIKAGQVWQGEFEDRKKSGELFSERSTISPVKDKAGKITRFIAINEDSTEHKKLESLLRQSQKMDAIGHLAAGVAHDFNNLLTVIQFESSVLDLNTRLDAESRESVGQILKATERAANLTRQLLTFSRKQKKETRLLDLADLVGNTTRLLRRLLGENIALSTRAAPGLPLLLADPGMLEQLIMNLAINSRDAMPNGGQLDLAVDDLTFDPATIAQHPAGRPGRFLRLQVRDTGTGIAPADLARIFEPFFTTKEIGKGTGLGLATVFGIVKQHEGWTEVAANELGHGTVFDVFLPAAPATEVELAGVPVAPPLRGGTETILIAEDEETLRSNLQIALERFGYRVLVAANGTEAGDLLTRNGGKVDLLITDLVMPGPINGRELAQQFQALLANLKVLYISGYASDRVTKDLHLEPGVNFLAKPFSSYAFVELVRRRLDGGNAKPMRGP